MALVKLNNRGVRSATTFGSISGLGEMRFIKKLTASSDSELSFVDGTDDVVLDDTYKEYIFTFNNIHPENDNKGFTFQTSTDGGSSYTNFTGNFSDTGAGASTEDWAKLRVTLAAPVECQSLQIKIQNTAQGSFQINDISIEYRMINKRVS